MERAAGGVVLASLLDLQARADDIDDVGAVQKVVNKALGNKPGHGVLVITAGKNSPGDVVERSRARREACAVRPGSSAWSQSGSVSAERPLTLASISIRVSERCCSGSKRRVGFKAHQASTGEGALGAGISKGVLVSSLGRLVRKDVHHWQEPGLT